MSKKSKRVAEYAEKIDKTQRFSIEEGVDKVKEFAKVKFDETVDVAIKLGVDPRKSDQMVRGAVSLPNGLGKEIRVLVFATGEKEQEAKDAGADFVGSDDLVEKIQGGWTDFDAAIATPPMMAKVGRIGKILGPRGLMPNPKTGTVTMDVAKSVKDAKGGKVQYKVEKAGIVHAPIGKASFTADKLVENLKALVDDVNRQKPSSAKGSYILSATVSSTMGPGVKLDPSALKSSKKG